MLPTVMTFVAVLFFGSPQEAPPRPAPPPTVQIPTGHGTVAGRVAVGPTQSVPPAAPDHEEDDDGPLSGPVPADAAPAILAPSDPQTSLTATTAASDFVVAASHDLTEVPTTQRWTNQEPSVGSMGDTVFMTGNRFAAVSTNKGQSFTFINPATTFPNINSGFCCDQGVTYAPAQDMMLWAVMYEPDVNTGTTRIARAVGSAAVASNTWTYFDFTPQMFGFPTGDFFDFPNMVVGSTYLYVSALVYIPPAPPTFTKTVVWRIPLSQLAAGGTLTFDYFMTDTFSPRCTEGATTTIYCAATFSTSAVRIFEWSDSSPNAAMTDVSISSYTYMNRDGVALTPDGRNWAGRADSRILGAWVAGGVLGFMWMARQDATFPYPYTVIARFNQSDKTLLSQNNVWNSSYAWLYPTASPNASGKLAGLINYGGGSFYPNTAYWIVDDVESGFSPLPTHDAAQSAAGPVSNGWGDYLTVRRHKDYPNSWVGALFTMGAGGTDADTVSRYVWFGRARDLPGFTKKRTGQITSQ